MFYTSLYIEEKMKTKNKVTTKVLLLWTTLLSIWDDFCKNTYKDMKFPAELNIIYLTSCLGFVMTKRWDSLCFLTYVCIEERMKRKNKVTTSVLLWTTLSSTIYIYLLLLWTTLFIKIWSSWLNITWYIFNFWIHFFLWFLVRNKWDALCFLTYVYIEEKMKQKIKVLPKFCCHLLEMTSVKILIQIWSSWLN